VRLRAIVSLGKQSDRRAIPSLLRGLTDSNRLVRLRAREALVGLRTEMVPIFEQVVAARDSLRPVRLLDRARECRLRDTLEIELQASTQVNEEEKEHLQNVLRAGTLPAKQPATSGRASQTAQWGCDESIPGDFEPHAFLVLPGQQSGLSGDVDRGAEDECGPSTETGSHRLKWIKETPMAPPITIIAPAHNEERSSALQCGTFWTSITRDLR